MKKFLSVILVLILVLSCSTSAFAAGSKGNRKAAARNRYKQLYFPQFIQFELYLNGFHRFHGTEKERGRLVAAPTVMLETVEADLIRPRERCRLPVFFLLYLVNHAFMVSKIFTNSSSSIIYGTMEYIYFRNGRLNTPRS